MVSGLAGSWLLEMARIRPLSGVLAIARRRVEREAGRGIAVAAAIAAEAGLVSDLAVALGALADLSVLAGGEIPRPEAAAPATPARPAGGPLRPQGPARPASRAGDRRRRRTCGPRDRPSRAPGSRLAARRLPSILPHSVVPRRSRWRKIASVARPAGPRRNPCPAAVPGPTSHDLGGPARQRRLPPDPADHAGPAGCALPRRGLGEFSRSSLEALRRLPMRTAP